MSKEDILIEDIKSLCENIDRIGELTDRFIVNGFKIEELWVG